MGRYKILVPQGLMEGLYRSVLLLLLPCIYGRPKLGPLDCYIDQSRFHDAEIEDYNGPRVVALNVKLYLQCREEYYKRRVFVKCAGEDLFFRSRPWCKRIVCPTEQIRNGIIQGPSSFYFNSTRHVKCHPGFVYIGAPDAICRNDGSWSESLGKCQAEADIKCPISVLTGDNINIQPKRITHGYNQSVSISCSEGYTYQGERNFTCQPGNKWSGEVGKCVRIVCNNYFKTMKNGHIRGDHIYCYGNKLEITCEPSYVYVGKEIICGEGGEWHGDIGQCQAMCPQSWNISNGWINITEVTPGSLADVVCDEGLSLEGKNYCLCHSDGYWSEPGICSAVRGKADLHYYYFFGSFFAGLGSGLIFTALMCLVYRMNRKKEQDENPGTSTGFYKRQKLPHLNQKIFGQPREEAWVDRNSSERHKEDTAWVPAEQPLTSENYMDTTHTNSYTV